MKGLVLLSMLSLFVNTVRSGIPVYDFRTFEPRLHLVNDTTYVINFWASWCAPCREEMPDLEKLHQTYGAERVKVILVSLDMPDHIETRLIPYLNQVKVTAETLLLDDPDFNNWINKVDSSWSGAIPATLVYKKENRIFLNRKTHYEELENIVKPIMMQP